jgi:hypothetical protein
VIVEFLRAGQIGVARTRGDKFLRAGIVFSGFDRKDFFPIGPIAIFDAQGDRSANGLAVAHTSKNLSVVFFDSLAPSAPVAELTAVQLVVDELEIDGELRGETGDKGKQSLPVRFASSIKFQHPRLYPRVAFCISLVGRDSVATATLGVQRAPSERASLLVGA